ncbi:MAG: flagellar export chaperone FliS [Fimbriimonadaceae bacterium]|nr:flagellar export chaperone FliS [Fimbriimonadaceae bacterium]QYK57622.1 MAG: flagellar export chaperone FliS [Fimbriimonadaceae bacterium]
MSLTNSQIDQYRKGAVSGASPLQLVVMLYDGALRFIEGGKRAMESGNRFVQNEQLTRAQRIIAELMSCLDMDRGEEIAQNLLALYSFCYNKLVEANLEDNPEPLGQVVRVLGDLRASWSQLEAHLRQSESVKAA